jgi:signal transduction histidine kinase
MGKGEVVLTIILFNLFFILFIVGVFIFIQQYKLKKKEHLAILTYHKEEHQKELLENHIEIQNQTMQYIGREIHDNVGQKLTLASLYTQQLAFENKAPHINENIENISFIINESLQELRELSKSLTDNSIACNTIDSLILNECEKVKKTKKCLINYTNDEVKQDLNYEQKSILIRICQEFIQNSLKHSKCKNIEVHLKQINNQLLLIIQDDGTGFDTATKSTGIGLQNMKKRTLLLNGIFDFQSNINKGTKLNITLPLS